ncbi:MAG TPA: hypothetical protein VF246_07690 [Acidimicrobiia bacterium]
MTPGGLTGRLEEIPGVASVTVDLTEEGGGISIRLEPGADESGVMERLRQILVAYGVRSPRTQTVEEALPDPGETTPELKALGIKVRLVPLEKGARIEVESRDIRSHRVVAANPRAIAQGMADAWCRVIGKIPVEVIEASIKDDGLLVVRVIDGDVERTGMAMVSLGWERSLTLAVGRALGQISVAD